MTSTWKATLGVILVFILGCLSGALGSGVYFAHRATLFLDRGSGGYVDLLEWRLTHNLDLDADQKAKIHDFFMENISNRKQLQARIQPDVQMVNLQTFQEIKSVLRPDQLTRFHQNVSEYRKRARPNLPPRVDDPPALGAPTNPPGAASP